MLDLDIGGFDFHDVPLTGRKAEMEGENLSSVEQWLIGLKESRSGKWTVSSDTLYAEYADWCKASGLKQKPINRFGNRLKEGGITKRKVRVGPRSDNRSVWVYDLEGDSFEDPGEPEAIKEQDT